MAETGVRAAPEPLRARRRRELRQQLSDVATRMFLEHGFDAVRVVDVARACGVTEKTVFNHFATKESLLADRWDAQIEALRTQLSDPSVPPVDAALDVLERELDFLQSEADRATEATGDAARALADLLRFSDLVRSTPSLVAHLREALDHLGDAATTALAKRSGASDDDPEPWITAAALTGLWTVYYRSLHRYLRTPADHARIAVAVRRDLHRAAVVLRQGLGTGRRHTGNSAIPDRPAGTGGGG